jgi:hypothetical protein
MASLTARNCRRLAIATKQWTDEDGWTHKYRRALRSDGAVLKAHDLLRPEGERYPGVPESRCWNRGGYSLSTSLKFDTAAEFADAYEAAGYTVKIDR